MLPNPTLRPVLRCGQDQSCGGPASLPSARSSAALCSQLALLPPGFLLGPHPWDTSCALRALLVLTVPGAPRRGSYCHPPGVVCSVRAPVGTHTDSICERASFTEHSARLTGCPPSLLMGWPGKPGRRVSWPPLAGEPGPFGPFGPSLGQAGERSSQAGRRSSVSGQGRSRDKSELERRAKAGGLPRRLPVHPSLGPFSQGSRVPSAGLAQPWGLLLSSGPHTPSAPPSALHTSRDLTRPQWNLRTCR